MAGTSSSPIPQRHKVAGVRQAIERVGATLCYLSPYSPDLIPLNEAQSPRARRPLSIHRNPLAFPRRLSAALQPRGMPQFSTLRLSGHHTVMKSALIVGFLVAVAFVEPLFPVLHADVGPVLGMTVYRWSRAHLHPTDAMVATVGVMACAPVLFGASEIYPDLPAGVTVLALVCWLWVRNAERIALGWCVYWCARRVSLLVACEVIRAVCRAGWARSLAPMARLEAHGLRPRVCNVWRAFPRGACLVLCVLQFPRSVMWLGGRRRVSLNTDVSRAAEIFWGLHLDQVHGLFVQ